MLVAQILRKRHFDQFLDRLQLSVEGECYCLVWGSSIDWWLRFYESVILISYWLVYSSGRRVNVIVWELCLVAGSDTKKASFDQLLDRLQLSESEDGEFHCLGKFD